MRVALSVVLVAALGFPAAALADDVLGYESEDWLLTAPAALGTRADIELSGRQIQLCHDEVEKLVGSTRPWPRKFTWTWSIGGGPGSYAVEWGVTTLVPSAEWQLVGPVVRPFREAIVAAGMCLGPHEVTHVLTFGMVGPVWSNEGFATFTDRLFAGSWRCCGPLPPRAQTCDADGYVEGGIRHSYADLSPFRGDFASYSAGACFWFEVLARGGFPALRGVLAGMRAHPPRTTGELVLHHASRVLNADLRPVLARYGFEPGEMQAGPAPSVDGCTLIGFDERDAIAGTSGSDWICGQAGNDTLDGRAGADRLLGAAGADVVMGGPGADVVSGGAGADVLDGGPGNDSLFARDGRRDVVRGGPGRDTARIDRGLDRVIGIERLV